MIELPWARGAFEVVEVDGRKRVVASEAPVEYHPFEEPARFGDLIKEFAALSYENDAADIDLLIAEFVSKWGPLGLLHREDYRLEFTPDERVWMLDQPLPDIDSNEFYCAAEGNHVDWLSNRWVVSDKLFEWPDDVPEAVREAMGVRLVSGVGARAAYEEEKRKPLPNGRVIPLRRERSSMVPDGSRDIGWLLDEFFAPLLASSGVRAAPPPQHEDFWLHYAEPVAAIRSSASGFVHAFHRLVEEPDFTAWLTGYLDGTAPSMVDHESGPALVWTARSLLDGIYLVLAMELTGSHAPRLCAHTHCGLPFFATRRLAVYCSPKCQDRAKSMRHRQKKKETSA